MINKPGDDSNYPANVRAPANGEPADEAYLGAGLTDLADRSAWLRKTVDAIGTRDGATRIREVADVAALKNLAGAAAGEWAFVPSVGLFRYDPAAIYMLPHTDFPAESVMSNIAGGWINLAWLTGAVARGVARLDDAGRLPAATAKNGVVGLPFVAPAGTETFTAATLTASAKYALSLDLAIGDVVDLRADAALALAGGATGADVRMRVTDPTPTDTDLLSAASVTGPIVGAGGRYVATVAGVHSVALYLAVSGGGSVALSSGGLAATVRRP